MPLGNRPADLKAAIRAAMDDPAYRTVHTQIDDDLGVQSLGGGGEIHQAARNDLAGPVGFFCRQAAEDEEIVVRCQAGDVVVAFKLAIPSDVASAGVHEPVLFDPSGNRIRCNGADGPEVTVGAGVCKVRSDGGRTVPVARDGDEAQSNGTFDTWAAAVELGVTAAGGSVATPWVAGQALAGVSASSTKLEAE